MAQWVKDPALTLQWLGSLLWCEFHPWPRNFTCCRRGQKKKKKSRENKTSKNRMQSNTEVIVCFWKLLGNFFFFFWSFFFKAASVASGSSQARVRTGAIAAGQHPAVATWDPSCVCDPNRSSWQCWVLNPLSKARD